MMSLWAQHPRQIKVAASHCGQKSGEGKHWARLLVNEMLFSRPLPEQATSILLSSSPTISGLINIG